MRRALLVLLILAAGGAAAWYFLYRLPPGEPPALAAQVSAEHTVMFSSVEKPDALFDAVFKAVQSRPALAERLRQFSPANAAAAMGFDPATAAGWQSAGIDPATGVAIVVDARLGQSPYAVLKIADEPKFLAWVSARAGAPATMADGALQVGTQLKVSVARRGAFTLIGREVATEPLQQVAQDGGPTLDTAPGFEASFAQTRSTGRLTSFVPLSNLRKAGPFAQGLSAETVDFFAGLFPALGGQLDADALRIRLVTSEPGLSAVRQLYAPRRSAPKFSKWLPGEGFILARLSVNLHECFTGLQALLPPSVPAEMRAQLGFAKIGLAAVGLDWSLLTQAFTGHAAVAVKPVDGRDPEFLALFSLGTPESADKIIASLQAKVPQLLGAMGGGAGSPVEQIVVGGAPARRIKLARLDVTIVRSDAMLVVASSPELAGAAITRAAGAPELTGRAAELMDADVIMALYARLTELTPSKAGSPQRAFAEAAPPLEGSIRLDRHGVVLETDTLGLLVAVGAGKLAMDTRRDAAIEEMKKLEDLNEMNRRAVDPEARQ